MIVDGYYTYLNKKSSEWLVDWQNKCVSKEMDILTCKKNIRELILTTDTSVPIQKNKQAITLTLDPKVHFTTFTGSPLDMICGFRYLEKNHDGVTSTLQTEYYDDPEVDTYAKSLGINTGLEKDLINFEIKWIFQQLFYPPNFDSVVKKIISTAEKKYIIIPIGIILSNGNHSNALIYNIANRQLERFEPHGSRYPSQFNYNPVLLDELIHAKFNNILQAIGPVGKKITYLTPDSYQPRIGLQTFENTELHINKNIGDPNGFCTLWCIWYLDYRLTYGTMNPTNLIRKIIKQIRLSGIPFRDIIRNYSAHITDFRDAMLRKINKDVNDYLNDRISKSEKEVLIREIMK